MKVALIGASGFLGKAVLNELANKGNTLLPQIVRNPENIIETERVKVVKGNALNTDEAAEFLNCLRFLIPQLRY